MKKTIRWSALLCVLAVLFAFGDPAAAAAEAPAEPGGEAYAWLGLQDMPRCDYLDALATAHYYREYAYTAVGNVYSDMVEAVDGVNRFQGTEYSRSYSIDGQSLGLDDNAMIYREQEDESSGSEAAQALEQAMASGENTTGRAFAGTGRAAVPAYDFFFDDETEYDYYEYNYPAEEEYGFTKIERYFLRDGDVFAVYYEESFGGEILSDYTEVIQIISTELPEGIFDLPDLTDYEPG